MKKAKGNGLFDWQELRWEWYRHTGETVIDDGPLEGRTEGRWANPAVL